MAVFRPNPSRLGEIEDISLGGIRVRYIAGAAPKNNFTELTLLKTGEHTLIKHLPFALVLDAEDDKPRPATSVPLRRSHIKFTRLTARQQRELGEFINAYRRLTPMIS